MGSEPPNGEENWYVRDDPSGQSLSLVRELFIPFGASFIPAAILWLMFRCPPPAAAWLVGVIMFVVCFAVCTLLAIGLFFKYGYGKAIIQRGRRSTNTPVRDAILFLEVVIATPVELTILVFAAAPGPQAEPVLLLLTLAFGLQVLHFTLVRLLAFRWD